jgi:hypothetical protein
MSKKRLICQLSSMRPIKSTGFCEHFWSNPIGQLFVPEPNFENFDHWCSLYDL